MAGSNGRFFGSILRTGNMMDIENYLSNFDKAEKINKGMAGDEKYHCWGNPPI